jgi:hypothetical protein
MWVVLKRRQLSTVLRRQTGGSLKSPTDPLLREKKQNNLHFGFLTPEDRIDSVSRNVG